MHRTLIAAFSLLLVCAVAQAEQVENPAYKTWAKFKPGTSTTLSMTSNTAGQSVKMEMKSTLSEVTDDKVVVEISNTIDMGGTKTAMPAQKVEVKKMMDTASTDPSQPAMDPNILAKASEENVTVPAGTFKAKIVEIKTNQQGTDVKSKVWFSEEVPGGTVKMEATTDGAMKSETKGELTALEKK